LTKGEPWVRTVKIHHVQYETGNRATLQRATS